MPETSSVPPALQRTALTLRTIGNISFWGQLVLGVISIVILVAASASSGFSRQANQAPNQGSGFGIFFAICGLVTLGVGAYFAFRYTQIAKQLLDDNASGRPSKADTLQTIRLGLIVNMVGMLLTILGAQATIGTTVLKSFAQGQGAFTTAIDPSQLVRSLDLLVVQSNTNTILAHFAGIAASLWLFNRVNR
jgi:hypothetical protein